MAFRQAIAASRVSVRVHSDMIPIEGSATMRSISGPLWEGV